MKSNFKLAVGLIHGFETPTLGLLQNFDDGLKSVLKHEGGYVNNPKDPGGATNKGITIGTLKRLGIDVDGDKDSDLADLKALRRSDVERVYREEYWDAIGADQLPGGLDYAAFDYAVNSGVGRARTALKAVKGMETRAAINAYCDERLAFLRRIRHKKTKASLWATFGKGWQRRVDEVRKLSLSMVGQPAKAPELTKESPVAPKVTPKAPEPQATLPEPPEARETASRPVTVENPAAKQEKAGIIAALLAAMGIGGGGSAAGLEAWQSVLIAVLILAFVAAVIFVAWKLRRKN